MKKILSILLALSMTASMLTVVAQAQTTETMYSFRQMANARPEDGTGDSRLLYIAAAKAGDRNIIYGLTQKALVVYDDESPNTPLQTVTAIADGRAVRADESNVYIAYKDKFCVFPKNPDGTVNVPESGGAADLTKIANAGAQGMKGIYLGDETHVLGHLPDGIRLYTITDGVPTIKSTISKPGVRALNLLKLADGTYRVVFISQAKDSAESIFNIYEWDFESGKYTSVFSSVLSGPDWPDTPSKFRNIEFLSETRIVTNYNHETTREEEKTFVIDFTDLENIQLNLKSETGLLRGRLMQLNPGEIISWNETTSVTDYNDGGKVITSSVLGTGAVKDADAIGQRVYLACDKKGFFIFDVNKKSVTDIPYTDDREVTLQVGEPVTAVLADTRIQSAAAAKINGRPVLYGKLKDSGELCAYDLTDPQQVTLLNSVAVTTGDTGVAVHNGYVLYAANKALEIRKIQDDGTIGGAVLKTISCSGLIQKILIENDILFISTNGTKNALTAYDVSNLSDSATVTLLGTVENTLCRDFDVEKLSSLRCRVYLLKPSTFGGVNTLGLKIADIKHGLSGMTVSEVFAEGMPSGDVWPGFGRYGKDSTVDGYIADSTTNAGNLGVVKSGTLRVSAGYSARDLGEQTAVENQKYLCCNDEYIIDVSNPAAPAVAAFTPLEGKEFVATQVRIDKNKAAALQQYGKLAVLRDFAQPENPALLAEIPAGGDCGILLDNMLYTTTQNSMTTVKLFEEQTPPPEGISEITVTDSEGNELTAALKADDITASITVNNPGGNAREITLVMALFDKESGSLQYMQLISDSVLGTKTIQDTISKTYLPAEQVGGIYLKVMAWEDLETMLPLQGAKVIG